MFKNLINRRNWDRKNPEINDKALNPTDDDRVQRFLYETEKINFLQVPDF
jgi:hypothetical protein